MSTSEETMDLNGKIEKALTCRRGSRLAGGRGIGMDGVPVEVVEALDAVARDSGTDRSDIIWKALKVFLQVYRYTRAGRVDLISPGK